ncbi:N-acetyltransferase ESCO2 isoform X2 [Varanus komodoensis]|uniref:N-acetyltransferase ESCO2 isoform X2 n=1 Tax=Varanus komodoensis TaxID=61221 RepID=UPI001CF7EA87|nr:N-acetyltransferase ESCO2 isoform X2 [Varanus komodoensis]
MAALTPRKRKRSSDGLRFAYGNPVKKLMMEFTEKLPADKVLAHHSFISPIKQTSNFQDEGKENQHSPQKSTKSQKLHTSPLQTANVPKGIQRAFPQGMSPESGATYSSIVPTSSFYSKAKQFQNLLERKLANESLPLSPCNDDGNLPIANKTEVAQVKVLTARNPNSKAAKRPPSSRQLKTLPRNTKKARVEAAPPKAVEQKERVNCTIEKKMDAPFRVLSMKFKPALKLQTGAAFFATRKKWHCASKKVPSSPPSLSSVSKPPEKEMQDRPLTHTDLRVLPESSMNEAGREEHALLQEETCDHTEDGEKLSQNASQKREMVCELNTRLLETPVGCSKGLTQKEMDAGTQGSEDFSKRSPRNRVPSLTDNIHPLFSGAPSNKKSRVGEMQIQSFRAWGLRDEQLSLVGPGSAAEKLPAVQRVSKKARELSRSLKDQMAIDAGQKHFGATACKSCGMVYSAANPEDEGHHVQHHQRLLEGIKYVSWKNEHVVAEFWDGKVLLILQNDPKYAIKKVEEVRKLVDNELGFKQGALACPSQTRTYLFVSNEKKIVGCLIAEPVRQAFRVLSEPAALLESPTKNSLEHQRAWCCSATPERVFCGVSRIWVFSLMRRKRIASRLVDVLRRTFLFGSCLSTSEIAFSDPTPDGKVFATKYCKTPNFLVYNFIS